MLLRKVVGFVRFAASRICWENHSKVVAFFFSVEVVPLKLLLYSYIYRIRLHKNLHCHMYNITNGDS